MQGMGRSAPIPVGPKRCAFQDLQANKHCIERELLSDCLECMRIPATNSHNFVLDEMGRYVNQIIAHA